MTNKKEIIAIISILIVFSFSYVDNTSGYKFEFITVSDIVKKIRKRFSDFESYQADFKIISEKAGSKSRQSGKCGRGRRQGHRQGE